MAETVVLLPPAIADLSFATHQDLTMIVAEWEGCLLDPVGSLVERIPMLASVAEWKPRGRATLSASMIKHLRAAAADELLIKAVTGVMPEAAKDGRLRPKATPLLLGLAVCSSLNADIGTESRKMAALLKKKAN